MKKLRFSIGLKLSIGFGIMALAIIINGILTSTTLQDNREKIDEITTIYNPSASAINDLFFLITNSKMLVKNWIYIDQQPETPDKLKLKKLHETDFPKIMRKLAKLSEEWSNAEQQQLMQIGIDIKDTLFPYHETVMNSLNSFEAYEDAMIMMFEIQPLVEDNGPLIARTDLILENIQALSDNFNQKVIESSEEIEGSFSAFSNFILIMLIVLVGVAIIIALVSIRTLVKPILFVRDIILNMSKGILPKEKLKARNDEIGDMTSAMNQLIDGLRETATFATQIGNNNLDTEFTPLSEKDELGNALIEMRKSLRTAREEEEKRKKEDQQRNWSTEGLAKFGDILRQRNNDLKEFAYEIIKNLVWYVEANQGGIYFVNEKENKEEDELDTLSLVSAYAYERRKYIEQEIEFGEGLIGACAFEKETIYLTDVPQDYITIKSGLGDANPTSVVIVPLRLEDEIHGVIELASFKEFEPYQIDFLEKIAETTASTIAGVKVNIKTEQLLKQSQEQAEQMQQQEEEMRQNMEEMQATQEEAGRREAEMQGMLSAVEKSTMLMEMEISGSIQKANENYLRAINKSESEVINRKHRTLFDSDAIDIDEYEERWDQLNEGIPFEQRVKYNIPSGEIWLKESYTPVMDMDEIVIKVLCIAEKIDV